MKAHRLIEEAFEIIKAQSMMCEKIEPDVLISENEDTLLTAKKYIHRMVNDDKFTPTA